MIVSNVRVKIKFYTVLDETMLFRALLDRDFLSYPSLRVILKHPVEIVNVESVNCIMQIDYREIEND